MNKTKQVILICLISISILLGGCSSMIGADNDETTENEYLQDDYEKENYVSIQEYTGEGYTIYDANEEYGEIAEENRDTVVAAVEHFFRDNYHVEVEVHNIVSAMDGVTVFVESFGEPHFNTFAIVPIDLRNEEIKTNSVWSRDGQVEFAIQGGLYAMAFEDEFSKLDDYFEEVITEYPVVGTPLETVRKVQAHGYSTSYYFIAPMGEVFKKLYEKYIEDPDITKQEIRDFFLENPIDSDKLNVSIRLFMEDSNTEPDENIFNEIVTEIEELEGIPRGAYSIYLNDNYIDKIRGDGNKQNTLERKYPEQIMKE